MKREKMNLVPAIRQIEEQISEIEREYKVKAKPYHDSLQALRKLNTACEKCAGKGKVLRRRACAEDDAPDPKDPRDYIKCDACGGTGIADYAREGKDDG